MAKLNRRSISRRTVEALTVEKDTVFWDRGLLGFGVRVYASGTKMYVVQSRAGGKSLRVTVGRHGVITADEARRRAARILNRIKAGEDPVAEPLPARVAGGPTVADLAARYMEEHVAVRCKGSTAEGIRKLVDKHILPAFGRLPLLAVARTCWRPSCSRSTGRTDFHSAYRYSHVTVEYRWHPFHGRRLHARNAGRQQGILLFVDGDPHVARKLPVWMCDPTECRAMTLGPPLVRADALSELSEVLAVLLPDRATGSSSELPGKEAADEATNVTTANPTPTEPGTAGSGGAAVDGAGAGPR